MTGISMILFSQMKQQASVRRTYKKEMVVARSTLVHLRHSARAQKVGLIVFQACSGLVKLISEKYYETKTKAFLESPYLQYQNGKQQSKFSPYLRGTKSLKPLISPSVARKRKRNSEAGGSSRAQDSSISPDDIWISKVSTTTTSTTTTPTTPAENTPAEVREENVATGAAEPILPPTEVPTPTPAPLVVESVIIEDDDEATNELSVAKKPKTSTSTHHPPLQPAQTFGQEYFDRIFEKAGTSAGWAERAHTVGFSNLVIPHKLTKSSKTPRNHVSSWSRLLNVFSTPSSDPRTIRSATISFLEDTNFLSRPIGVANYMRPLIS
ncbi:hypothetical protein RND71_025212 [Anisodus tanguticus]|uniref:Uncharacterized protein n=1 Tax=Anisodus tanguticus TaxID=243964 RepID=A0AAE1RSI5_9SOLA|nr:hypothetical protein RND71_025212 [Anisodus tanguticus]